MEYLKSRLTRLQIASYLPTVRALFSQLVIFLLSFLFGGISFAGGISPFSTGFIAGMNEKYLISAALGGAFGYVSYFGFIDALRFVSSIFIICILKLAVSSAYEERKKYTAAVLIASLCTFCTSLCVFLAVGGKSSFIVFSLCESVISGAFAFFSTRILHIYELKQRGTVSAVKEQISSVFFAGVLLLSLERFSLSGFTPARSIAYFAIMLFALAGNEASPGIMGICSALTLGFNEAHPQLMTSYILTGLSTGFTRKYGRIPVALSMVLSVTLSLILAGREETAVIAIGEAALSGVIFSFIPDRYLYSIADKADVFRRRTPDEEKTKALGFFLSRSAKAVKDISDSVGAVSEWLEKTDRPTTAEIPEAVRRDVCEGCVKYEFCWSKCREATVGAFNEARAHLEENEKLISEELPLRITTVCRMPDRITDGFNRAFYEYTARLISRSEISDIKLAAAKQFYSLGSLLQDAAKSIDSLPETDPVLAASADSVLRNLGFTVSGICAYSYASGGCILQAYCSYVPVMPDPEKILDGLYEATGKIFLSPVRDEYSKDGTVLSFCEQPLFSVDYHTSAHTGSDEIFSGDTARCFYDGLGNFYAVLSDGMGTGSRAAADSVMTCTLTARLLRSGFSPESALETVNCAMLIKSGDESLATVDILKIELNTGNACFYKAGAAYSVIKKGDRVLAVEQSSLPLGILRETEFQKSEISLGDGDTVFIVSDGAAVIPHTSFKELIQSDRTADPEQLSEKIVNNALLLSEGAKHDDITVCCIKLEKAAPHRP